MDFLDQAVQLLKPFMAEDRRDTWLTLAFHVQHRKIYDGISQAGATADFTARCVRILLDRGCLGKQHALSLLLEAVAAEAGDDQQARFRSLIEALDQQCGASVALPHTIEGCPFVGLDAYRSDQTHLFFGRQQETLDALACFDTRGGGVAVRWLEINGNSGSSKSSLMNAGLLPLVDQGWLSSRTGYKHWHFVGPIVSGERRIGAMMPGEHPIAMLAECLARSFGMEMADVRRRLEEGDDRSLADWLRSRKEPDTAFLLVIDQFEELFTFADPDERARFDRLLATALADADCQLFLISTVRADFLDRFEVDLPRLRDVRNRLGRQWTLGQIGADGLREVISGPARLVGLDVGAVQEAMLAQAQDEPGALPLVENALYWLWQQRRDHQLSGELFTAQGGLAGILSNSADELLTSLGKRRELGLELLLRLVKVDPAGRRHTRRPMPLAEAVAVAGGGDAGRNLVNVLAGERTRDGNKVHGPLRLITITEETAAEDTARGNARWVNLIHETLIKVKGSAEGKPQPYWPTLWNYIDEHKARAAQREHLQLLARQWQERKGWARLFGLVGWLDLFSFWGLAAQGSLEQRYLRWSMARALAVAGLIVLVATAAGESVYWAKAHDLPIEAITARWAYKLGKPLPLPNLVAVPAGQFEMGERGQREEEPVHRVIIARPFYLAKTETTFAEYEAFSKATGRDAPSDAGSGRGNQPAIFVSWFDARAYAKWLGAMTGESCRLPSEAEWEYAARAGTTTNYPWGDEPGRGQANFRGSGSEWSAKRTAPAGSFPANAWGLHDMHGNVWEWVEDSWHNGYDGAPDDGRAWLEEGGGDIDPRVVRGGSSFNDPGLARSAARDVLNARLHSVSVGFRVLCSSPIE